jgi:hypothetical protein
MSNGDKEKIHRHLLDVEEKKANFELIRFYLKKTNAGGVQKLLVLSEIQKDEWDMIVNRPKRNYRGADQPQPRAFWTSPRDTIQR